MLIHGFQLFVQFFRSSHGPIAFGLHQLDLILKLLVGVLQFYDLVCQADVVLAIGLTEILVQLLFEVRAVLIV